MSMCTNLASNLITQAPSKMLENAMNLIASFKLITSMVEPKKSKWLKRKNVVIMSKLHPWEVFGLKL
jgi:hypothetical protein